MDPQPPYHKLASEFRALQLRCEELERDARRLDTLLCRANIAINVATEQIEKLTAKLKSIPCPRD